MCAAPAEVEEHKYWVSLATRREAVPETALMKREHHVPPSVPGGRLL